LTDLKFARAIVTLTHLISKIKITHTLHNLLFGVD
jgi:hypothetical protein